MSAPDLRAQVIDALAEVAPELDPAALDPEAPIRDQLDVDSLDFLDFVAALSEIHGTDIPESDYAELSTVDSCAAYLAKTPSA